MNQKLVYLVQRYEMPMDDTPGCPTYPERVFKTLEEAFAFCRKQDPTNEGFEYKCPCGCEDIHWRSWDVEPVVMETP